MLSVETRPHNCFQSESFLIIAHKPETWLCPTKKKKKERVHGLAQTNRCEVSQDTRNTQHTSSSWRSLKLNVFYFLLVLCIRHVSVFVYFCIQSD